MRVGCEKGRIIMWQVWTVGLAEAKHAHTAASDVPSFYSFATPYRALALAEQ